MDREKKEALLAAARSVMSRCGVQVPEGDVDTLEALNTRRVAFALSFSDAVNGNSQKIEMPERISKHPANDVDVFWENLGLGLRC